MSRFRVVQLFMDQVEASFDGTYLLPRSHARCLKVVSQIFPVPVVLLVVSCSTPESRASDLNLLSWHKLLQPESSEKPSAPKPGKGFAGRWIHPQAAGLYRGWWQVAERGGTIKNSRRVGRSRFRVVDM